MTISALEVDMRADALVRIMRSDAPLESARRLVDGVPERARRLIAAAFVARARECGDHPMPERGTRLHDWLAGLRDGP